MFEKEIKFITDFNLNKIKKSGSFFTITHLAAANVHPAIIQYISAELDYLISIDRNRLLQKSVFDYSGEVISNYLDLISNEIKKEKLIPYEDIKRLISQAVEFNVYYLIRPRWCLKKFIFGDEEIRSHKEIKTYLNYTYFFDYYKNIIQAILDKKKIVSISVYEFEDIIVNLEKQLIQKQQQTFIENALQSLAEFFNLGEISKSKISVGIVEKFLYEKGLLNEIFKVRKILSVDQKSKFEVEEFKQAILSNIFVETSDIEITEKIFEMPKTSFEQTDQIEVQEGTEISQSEFELPENLNETKSDFINLEADYFEEENLPVNDENTASTIVNEFIEDDQPEEPILNDEDDSITIAQTVETDFSETTSETEEVVDDISPNEFDGNIESDSKTEMDIDDSIESIVEVKLDSEIDEEISLLQNDQIEKEVVEDVRIEELSSEENGNDLQIEELVQSTPFESEVSIVDENKSSEEVIHEEMEETQNIEESNQQDEAVTLYEEFLNSVEVISNDLIEEDELKLPDLPEIETEYSSESEDFSKSEINDEENLPASEISELPVQSEESEKFEIEENPIEQKDDEYDLLKTIEEEIENLQNVESGFIDIEVETLFEKTELQISEQLDETTEFDLAENSIESEENLSLPSYEVVDEIIEENTIVEVETQPDEIVETFDTHKTEIEPIKENITPIKYVIKASADEIFNLFSSKETTKIISSIFQKDELDFVHTVEQISECKNYKQVEEILNLVFHSYRINSLTQKEAIIFKEKIAFYFKGKEK